LSYAPAHDRMGLARLRGLAHLAAKEEAMSIAKVIEVLAEGDSIEDAVQAAVSEAAETVRGIKQVYVESFQAIVEDDEVVKYRVNAKITFVVRG
jgi:flavin-binding protein dodecin